MITRGPSVRNRAITTVGSEFTNVDFNPIWGFGFTAVDSGNGACRWSSAAQKGTAPRQTTNASDLMANITFAYCSSAQDVNSGGPGGAVTLAFYEGYTWGGAGRVLTSGVPLVIPNPTGIHDGITGSLTLTIPADVAWSTSA